MSDIYDETYLKIADLTDRHEKLNHLSWEEHREIANLIGLNSKKTVLDLCCGRGGISKFYAREFGTRVFAVDASPTLINDAKKQIQEAGLSEKITLKVGKIPDVLETLPQFDVVTCFESLCHIDNRYQAFQKIVEHVKGEGCIVIHDWVVKKKQQNALLSQLYKAWHFASLEIRENYVEFFRKNNIKIILERDMSQSLVNFRIQLYEKSKKVKNKVEKLMGKDSTAEYLRLLRLAKEASQEGLIGATLIIGSTEPSPLGGRGELEPRP